MEQAILGTVLYKNDPTEIKKRHFLISHSFLLLFPTHLTFFMSSMSSMSSPENRNRININGINYLDIF